MIRLAEVPVIDIHVHIQPWRMLAPPVLAEWKRNNPDFERQLDYADHPAEFLKLMDRWGLERCALINYVSPDVMGFDARVNEFVSEYCQAEPKRLIPVGSVHPTYVKDAAAEMDRLVEQLGIRMIKIHPPHQRFAANAYLNGLESLATIYERAQAHDIPVLIHTGTSIFPGARSKYGDPMDLDDIAIDFPKLTLILAHGGRPIWMESAFFVLRRHSNVLFDISGIPPKNLLNYFPRLEMLADKTLFGSDWPGPGVKNIRANIDAFLELPLSDAAKRAILYDNAARLFDG